MLRAYYAFLPVVRMLECAVTVLWYVQDQNAGLAVSLFWLSFPVGLLLGAIEAHWNLNRTRNRTGIKPKMEILLRSPTHPVAATVPVPQPGLRSFLA